ncbi:sigma-54-dependent Fis family transcriptional regulator [Clostridium estertheticum]|uniref:sigma-54-dependent Fis family transcriptional regulator n=1 Tax=Clostridium estertheticum TaxID=238834 RepID=UPI001CF3541B|nr:sigma-54-dependent Fis family transcriptional regulator [Clostridium estertheticum]MCB2305569.1 sigma-54-dependent Fis family transcriptional regulator [Clostridium estertheticum]MCB2344008.1 sigma-54-dependent Fis family transcriptional regulator [Clostridium estertheticum]MCB2348924.1 sigma-54-dependent Fis family transcriptional regulator [Clostridium estertheticum]WAG47872.1 sigma-54-dependent Fis family transcriptional regulator [Clostridium estertheticum]
MSGYMEFISKAWEEFVKQGDMNNDVRLEIADSWKRCKGYGVDFMDGRGNDVYAVSVESKIKENAELVSVARPIMEDIHNIIAGSGFALFLSDRDGYILDIIGESNIIQKANELNFVKGALWTERAVGTNAIGTAIHLDKPIQTIGAEHYGINQHSWTCSSAPIHDEEGNIIGCINMSGICRDAHLHTLGIVTAAAESIKKQLALIISYDLLNITFDSIVEGMIVIDENFNIKRINDRAENILGITQNEIFKMNIKETLKDLNFDHMISSSRQAYNNIECDFHIRNNRIKCIINAVAMKVNHKFMGSVITFRETQYVHKLVNKVVGYKATYKFDDIISDNGKMKSLIEFAKKAAKSDCNILIEGPSGTGKELVAQSIHNYSKRQQGPFVAINCASIPRELVESELFGYDRGAFTGAIKEGHPGKFELADGGTIFLDEVGELPLDIQSKLLRVLDNNKIVRVGGTYEKELNVRIICATNKRLKEEVKKKTFRADLYYRLNVMNIKTIPLVERKEDIGVLAKYFIDMLNMKNNDKIKVMNKNYITNLIEYEWPGNVRELRNVIERDYYSSEDNIIGIESSDIVEINKCIGKTKDKEIRDIDIIPIDILEKESITKALKFCQGNLVKAAKMLKISRSTMYRKIKKYNINNV